MNNAFQGEKRMVREYLVDNLKNFSAQGDLVTLTFDRMTMVDGKEEPVGEAVVKLTMKGQNLVNMTNALGNILEKVKEKNSSKNNKEEAAATTDQEGS